MDDYPVMTDAEALAEAVRRTGVAHYAYLCSVANTHPPPNDPATWRRHMHTVVARAWPPAGPPDRPTAAESVALVRRMRTCPYRGLTPPCGCQGARCALRHGAVVSFEDCRACLEKYEPLDLPGGSQ